MANEQNKGTQNTSTGSGSDSPAFSEKNQDKTTNIDGKEASSTGTGSSNFGSTGSTSSGSTGNPSTSSSGGSFGSSSGSSNPGTTGSSNIGSTEKKADSTSGLSVESAKETAKGLYDQAKDTAGQAFGAATKRATEALDEKKVTVASGLTSVADSIKQVGENLNTATDEPNPIAETAAKYTNSLASQIENLSGYFERKDVRDMVRDVETFARRNPAYFIGGAVALGFLAARFLKSSNPKQRANAAGRTFSKGYDTGKALTAGDKTSGSNKY